MSVAGANAHSNSSFMIVPSSFDGHNNNNVNGYMSGVVVVVVVIVIKLSFRLFRPLMIICRFLLISFFLLWFRTQLNSHSQSRVTWVYKWVYGWMNEWMVGWMEIWRRWFIVVLVEEINAIYLSGFTMNELLFFFCTIGIIQLISSHFQRAIDLLCVHVRACVCVDVHIDTIKCFFISIALYILISIRSSVVANLR